MSGPTKHLSPQAWASSPALVLSAKFSQILGPCAHTELTRGQAQPAAPSIRSSPSSCERQCPPGGQASPLLEVRHRSLSNIQSFKPRGRLSDSPARMTKYYKSAIICGTSAHWEPIFLRRTDLLFVPVTSHTWLFGSVSAAHRASFSTEAASSKLPHPKRFASSAWRSGRAIHDPQASARLSLQHALTTPNVKNRKKKACDDSSSLVLRQHRRTVRRRVAPGVRGLSRTRNEASQHRTARSRPGA